MQKDLSALHWFTTFAILFFTTLLIISCTPSPPGEDALPTATTTTTATPTLPPAQQVEETATPSPPGEDALPTSTATATETPAPPPARTGILVTGTLWRLFASYEPAGVAAAEVILSVNGVELPAVMSMIDGVYSMEVDEIQPGDVLRLYARAPQDTFEPLYYEWQSEAGMDHWEFDFYSYWEPISPPEDWDQNRISGWVLDGRGQGISGLHLVLQMGTSDALQLIGPTDASGFFEALVTLPSRVMVTVWVKEEGFLPSRLLFFHPYEPEDRQLIFRQLTVPEMR